MHKILDLYIICVNDCIIQEENYLIHPFLIIISTQGNIVSEPIFFKGDLHGEKFIERNQGIPADE